MWINRTALAAGIFLFLALAGTVALSGCAEERERNRDLQEQNHNSHWAQVINVPWGRTEKINGFIGETLGNPDSEKKFSAPEGEVRVATKRFGDVSTAALAVGEKIYSGFPLIDSNSSFKVEVGPINEWANKLEGYVGVDPGGPAVYYFAADYAYNRDNYKALNEKDANCILWGIGYEMHEIQLPETKPIYETGKYWIGKGFTSLFPAEGPGNYDFTGVVREVKDVNAFGSDAFMLKMKIVETLDGTEVVIPILVLKSNFEGTPQVGDGVEGEFWLSGKLAEGEK